ncbi:MAG: hypothetical protein ACLKAK_02960 [Alkaliphilus sp.]
MKMFLLFTLLILLLFTGCQRKTPLAEEGETSKPDTSTVEEVASRNYAHEDTVNEVKETTEIDSPISDDEEETTGDSNKSPVEEEEVRAKKSTLFRDSLALGNRCF